MTPRRPLAALLATLLLAACAQSAPTNWHALTARAPAPPAASGAAPRVGLEPVRLPAAVDRGELVVTAAGGAPAPSPDEAWIGPLDEMLTLVVAENLAGHLGVDQVFRLPTRRLVQLDRVVELDVVRLAVDTAGEVRLAAVWRLFDDRERLLRTGRIAEVEPFTPAATLTPAVDALARATDRLTAVLAAAIRTS